MLLKNRKILKAKELKEKEAQKKRQAEIDNLLSQADIAFNLQDWELAKEKLDAVLILEPEHVQAQVKLAIVKSKLQEIKENLVKKKQSVRQLKKAEQERKERERLEREAAAKEKAEHEAAERFAREKAEKNEKNGSV